MQPIFISVDPARDTPAVLRRFVAAFHPRLIGLTGSEAEIAQVARRYGIFYERGDAEPGRRLQCRSQRQARAVRAGRRADRDLLPHDEGAGRASPPSSSGGCDEGRASGR